MILVYSGGAFCAGCGVRLATAASYCVECGAAVDRGQAVHDRGHDRRGSFENGYARSTITSSGDAIPGDPATIERRTGAWALTYLVPNALGYIPVLGWTISIAFFAWNLLLYQRGQDIGARLLGLRVVRDTGDLAGFYQMWGRGLAASVSFIVIGAGFWTAYFHPDRRTWHDRWLGTYVVAAGPEVDDLPGTSSTTARTVFMLSLVAPVTLLVIGGLLWALVAAA